MKNAKMLGMLVAAFVAGSFIASPELRAYAANTVFSTDIKDGEVKTPDIANNAVTATKIKDGEVKAAEIATDAVGASELAGVDKLIFADCKVPARTIATSYGNGFNYLCPVAGIDPEDDVIFMDNTFDCFEILDADIDAFSNIALRFWNTCDAPKIFQASHLSIMVYDELPDKVPPG
jgi:hypothetical protein